MDKKICAIIPARGGSKGIPRKNIQLVAGKPLIAYSIEKALQSKHINRVLVSTDDNEIAHVANTYGAEVLMRPKQLAQDDTPDLPVIQHILQELKKHENYVPEYVVHLRPTCPLRSVSDIDRAIENIINIPCDSVRTISEVKHHPYWTYTLKKDKMLPFLKKHNIKKYFQRQLLPPAYFTNGACDVMKVETILKTNTLYGEDVRGIITPLERSIDIDSEFDIKLVDMLLGTRGE